MHVDLSRIVGAPNLKVLDAVIDEFLKQSRDANDPIYISDLLVDWQESGSLLSALRESKESIYKLLVLRDKWGNVPQPGDKVKRKYKNSLMRHGLPIPTKELNAWKRRGIYEQKRFTYKELTVDEKGCIEVDATDAEHFLSLYGIHGKSGMTISQHPYEQSKDLAPVDPKNPKGEKLHVWYWRFKEVDKEMYDKLELRKPSKESKRGKIADA